jgi:ribosomal 50S subunit-recycling heat shock protein
VRLDKFLQVSRLVRRRTLANSLCHAGRVTLNGRPALPAAPVRPGDLIAFDLGGRRVQARVRTIDPPRGRAAGDYCDMLGEEDLCPRSSP